MYETNDLRVVSTSQLVTPNELKKQLPISNTAAENVATARKQIESIIDGDDLRFLAIIGPCSIHEPKAALDYANKLLELRMEFEKHLLICMRVYFEKPRTTVGWKGLINDPGLDGGGKIDEGLYIARQLLLDLAEMNLPAATEMLDPISPQYIADLVCWTAIGARTTESQTHREMSSGLSMPVGFKNGTDGDLKIAINAMKSARQPHHFLGIDGLGRVCNVCTRGNPYCHVVLRGGSSGPNYSDEKIGEAVDLLREAGLNARLLIDCSHANSNKDHRNQPQVLRELAQQIRGGTKGILGFMLESNLVAGRQELGPWNTNLIYGQSITDACIDFPTTDKAIRDFVQSL